MCSATAFDAGKKFPWKPGSHFENRCQCLRALPSLLHTHRPLSSVNLIYGERQRNVGWEIGSRKEKNWGGGRERGEVAKGKGNGERQTRQRKNCFPFYAEREPSNQDDFVQLCSPLNTHELAIKCGSGRRDELKGDIVKCSASEDAGGNSVKGQSLSHE